MRRGDFVHFPYFRTIKRDLKLLVLLRNTEEAPKELARRLNINVHKIYNAQYRERIFKKFYAEQLCEMMRNGNIEIDNSNA